MTAESNNSASSPLASGIMASLAATIILALVLSSCLLCIPPLVVHVTVRNLPASSLIGSFVLVNGLNFISAFIWPHNPTEDYDGTGLCDVEIKIYIAFPAIVAGATASIFRQLARVLNTEQATLMPSKGQAHATLVFEYGTCFGVAVYSMAVHYVVQPQRYILAAIRGCAISLQNSWVSIVLIIMWPPILYLVAGGYCTLATCRLIRHRRDVSGILVASNIPKSRYFRLFILVAAFLLVNLPIAYFTLANDVLLGSN